jgi:hypothetical protein
MKSTITFLVRKSGCIGFALLCASGLIARAGDAPVDSKETKDVTAPAPEDPWKFQLAVPGWLAATSGTVGVNGFNSHVYLSADELLKHLDMTASLSTEVRYQRFGFYGDFLYVSASDTMSTNGLVNKASVSLAQWIADMELNYRAIEGDWGWLDLRAGTRYTNIYNTLSIYPNDGQIDRASQQLVTTVGSALKTKLQKDLRNALNQKFATLPVPDLGAKLQARVLEKIQTAKQTAQAKAEAIRAQVTAAIQAQLAAKIAAIRENIQSRLMAAQLPVGGLTPAMQAQLAAQAAALQATAQPRINAAIQNQSDLATAIQEQLQAQIAGLGSAVQAQLAARTAALEAAAQARINAARQRGDAALAAIEAQLTAQVMALQSAAQAGISDAMQRAQKRIASALKTNLNRSLSLGVDWWDPYVGLGGHYNINKTFYLAGKADIGGFQRRLSAHMAGLRRAWLQSHLEHLRGTRLSLYVHGLQKRGLPV